MQRRRNGKRIISNLFVEESLWNIFSAGFSRVDEDDNLISKMESHLAVPQKIPLWMDVKLNWQEEGL